MDDILRIVDLLRERAEADLVRLQTQHKRCLAQISAIKTNISDTESLHDTSHQSIVVDRWIWEKWLHNQMRHIKTLEKNLNLLDDNIRTAKARYKSILAKQLAVQSIVEKAERREKLRIEDLESEKQLDIFRQTTRPRGV